MVVRVFVCFVLSALALSGGLASAAPRYSDWGNTTYFAAVNTPELEFANGISKDGLTFYFQRGNALANGEDIWIAHRASTDAPWDAPLRLPDTVNSAFNDRAAIESSDGHWLYLASNRPGGKGDFDLYVSWRQHTHDDLGWQAPVPLTCPFQRPTRDNTGHQRTAADRTRRSDSYLVNSVITSRASKLVVRVRFPSPAPHTKGPGRA